MSTGDTSMSGKWLIFVRDLIVVQSFSNSLQGLQTLIGVAMGMLFDGDLMGSEDHDLAVWINRVHLVFAALPNLFYLTGVDFKTMTINLSGPGSFFPLIQHSKFDLPGIEVLLGKLLYWYLVPAFQLLCALIIADISMYFLHRLGHSNKWLYSEFFANSHGKDV